MKGRIALVTGGIGEIGTAICKEFIQQGARVIAADYIEPAVANSRIKEQGLQIEYVQVNVTDFISCQNMAEKVGIIDILVNAAGTLDDVTFRKMSVDQWNHVVHTDLDSMFNVTKQFIDGMVERKYGRIISIASVNAEKGQFGQTNYSAAKSGIYGFTKSLAQEVAKYGITVNAISPGFAESKMFMSIPEEKRKEIISQIPVGRLAKPEEIAWAIAFLAAERSGFITGSNLAINGGIHM